jgi:predicted nucleic acid-binding Zn ribbon protein
MVKIVEEKSKKRKKEVSIVIFMILIIIIIWRTVEGFVVINLVMVFSHHQFLDSFLIRI